MIVGTADPGGTLERADPFDPVHPRRVTLIVGPSGGGKTVLTNALCLRYIAQGGRTFILDRSSTPDEHGNTKGTGHYDTLASLIPGSRRVQVGHAGGDVICPWDVADPARVPAHKTELLLALHALLIGHAHDPEGRVRTLDSDEETLIRTGIEAAYTRRGRDRRATARAAADRRAHRTRRRRARSPAPTPTGCSRCCCASSPTARTGASPHRRPRDHRPGGHAADAVRLHRPVRAAHAGADARDRRVRRAPGAATAPGARRRRARPPRRLGGEVPADHRGGLGAHAIARPQGRG